VKNAGTDNENLNRLRRAKTKVMVTGQATPTFIVMNPTDLEVIDTITDANREYLLGGPTTPGQRTLWGLRVVESQNIAAGTSLVGDGTMAAVVDRSQGKIYTADQHSDFFVRNIFVILAEERLALPVFRPTAFAKVTLA
jgi:HK97 family phage major capsid protein